MKTIQFKSKSQIKRLNTVNPIGMTEYVHNLQEYITKLESSLGILENKSIRIWRQWSFKAETDDQREDLNELYNAVLKAQPLLVDFNSRRGQPRKVAE